MLRLALNGLEQQSTREEKKKKGGQLARPLGSARWDALVSCLHMAFLPRREGGGEAIMLLNKSSKRAEEGARCSLQYKV